MGTVSRENTVPETEETVLDSMIRAGAKQGYGYEDIYVEIKAAGVKVERDYVRSIVIPKRTTAPQRGASLAGPLGTRNSHQTPIRLAGHRGSLQRNKGTT